MDYIFVEAYIIREMIFTGRSRSDILINNYEVSKIVVTRTQINGLLKNNNMHLENKYGEVSFL